MARVYVSAVMNATLEQAWGMLRDFGDLGNYHPFFENSYIEDGWPADRIGCVRHFSVRDGGDICASACWNFPTAITAVPTKSCISMRTGAITSLRCSYCQSPKPISVLGSGGQALTYRRIRKKKPVSASLTPFAYFSNALINASGGANGNASLCVGGRNLRHQG